LFPERAAKRAHEGFQNAGRALGYGQKFDSPLPLFAEGPKTENQTVQRRRRDYEILLRLPVIFASPVRPVKPDRNRRGLERRAPRQPSEQGGEEKQPDHQRMRKPVRQAQRIYGLAT